MSVTPNGRNINAACGSLHPQRLAARVVEEKADIGIAYDGDADRALWVDERGRLLNGDHTLYVLARHMKDIGRLVSGTVVATTMSNMGLEIALNAMGLKLVRTKVGDKYVLEKMREIGAKLGGEQSGHTILLSECPDGRRDPDQPADARSARGLEPAPVAPGHGAPRIPPGPDQHPGRPEGRFPRAPGRRRGDPPGLQAPRKPGPDRCPLLGNGAAGPGDGRGRGSAARSRDTPTASATPSPRIWGEAMIRLSVNVDHFASLRQARRAAEPEPVLAALLAEQAGADGITAHLRGDRRHINERDLLLMREVIKTKLTLEMAATEEMTAIAAEAQARRRLPRPGAARGADDDGRPGRRSPTGNRSPPSSRSSPAPASGRPSSSIPSRPRSTPASPSGRSRSSSTRGSTRRPRTGKRGTRPWPT